MRTHGAVALVLFSVNTVSSQPRVGQTQQNDQASTCEPASSGGSSNGYLLPVDYLNRALPPWLRVGGEYRSRIEGEYGIKYTRTQDLYLLNRFRLNVAIEPTKWLTLFGEAQDARVYFDQHVAHGLPNQNTWDIRQAYVKVGSSTEGWADLTVGRQNFSFGDERVIGPSDWINMGRTFDAVRLDLHHSDNKVSLFASSVIVGRDGVIDHHIQGNNLYGIYGSFKNAIPGATLEPYVLWRLAPANAGLPESAGLGHLNEVTEGVHVAGTLPAGFDYNIEMDLQTGSLGSKSIRSWAGFWNVGKTFSSMFTTPRIYIESNYASGTKNPNGRDWNTFDQLYPSSHDKLDFADQVGRKNIQQVRAGVEEKIGKNWKFRQTYESLWLATTHDALYASGGSISIPADPAARSRHIGQEIDVIAQYDVKKGIAFGFGYARLFSGGFLKSRLDRQAL
jgi:hypothetical protein